MDVPNRLLVITDEKWWAMWSRIMPWDPTKFVYLKPTLDKCMERVVKRGREGEVKEAEEQDAEGEGEDVFAEKVGVGAGLDAIAEQADDEASTTSADDNEAGNEVEEQEDDSGGDGVLGAYQARLCRAHDCYLLGQHADEFPLMP